MQMKMIELHTSREILVAN